MIPHTPHPLLIKKAYCFRPTRAGPQVINRTLSALAQVELDLPSDFTAVDHKGLIPQRLIGKASRFQAAPQRPKEIYGPKVSADP